MLNSFQLCKLPFLENARDYWCLAKAATWQQSKIFSDLRNMSRFVHVRRRSTFNTRSVTISTSHCAVMFSVEWKRLIGVQPATHELMTSAGPPCSHLRLRSQINSLLELRQESPPSSFFPAFLLPIIRLMWVELNDVLQTPVMC